MDRNVSLQWIRLGTRSISVVLSADVNLDLMLASMSETDMRIASTCNLSACYIHFLLCGLKSTDCSIDVLQYALLLSR